MTQRGRKSATSLEIVAKGSGTTEILPRPEAPPELTPEQANIWAYVTNSMPADWFRPETHGLLTQYCRHAVSARRIAEILSELEQSAERFNTEEYDKLLKMQEREGRAMGALARGLRMSLQSSYDPKKVKKNVPDAPWLRKGE